MHPQAAASEPLPLDAAVRVVTTNIRAPVALKSLEVMSLTFPHPLKKLPGKISQEKYEVRKISPPCSATAVAEHLLPHGVAKSIQFSPCASAGGHHLI